MDFYFTLNIAIDNSGNVYVAGQSRQGEAIQKFDSNGTYLTGWGKSSDLRTVGIGVDTNGTLFVSSSFNQKIYKFSSSGAELANWGYQGTGDGYFIGPNGVAVDGNGYVYVTDTHNSRIQKFDGNGTFITKWSTDGTHGNGTFGNLTGIATDAGGNYYVSDSTNNTIQKYDANGNFMFQLGSYGTGNGQFNSPGRIATDSSGNLYVCDAGNYRVQKFTPGGTFVTAWGSQGSADGQMMSCAGLAVDGNNFVYLADSSGNTIHKFSTSGTFAMKWGSAGNGDGQFSSPSGVTVDSTGNVYIVDANNKRIQKFNGSGTYLSQQTVTCQPQYFNWLENIAIDPANNLYIIDSAGTINRQSPDGVCLERMTDQVFLNDEITYSYQSNPTAAAFDGNGILYVANYSWVNRVQKYNWNYAVKVTKNSNGSGAITDGVKTSTLQDYSGSYYLFENHAEGEQVVITTTASPDSVIENSDCATQGGIPGGSAQSQTCTFVMNNLIDRAFSVTLTQPVVKGVCGSAHGTVATTAPTTNLCEFSSTTPIVYGNGPWYWSCIGSGGGASSSCLANNRNWGGWTELGRPTTGSIEAIALSNNYFWDNTAFATSTIDGIFRSTDGGTTWTAVNNGLDYRAFRAITLSLNFWDDRTVFAGANDGHVYKSINAGDSWIKLTSSALGPIESIAVSLDKTIFVTTSTAGVFKSVDGGGSWNQVNTGISGMYVMSVALSPNYFSDSTVYISNNNAGVFKSTDGGSTWVQTSAGMTNLDTRKVVLSPGFSTDQTLFSGTYGGGIFKSVNAGNSWFASNTNLLNGDIHALAVSPSFASDATVYTGTYGNGVFKSTNGASSWQNVIDGMTHPYIISLAVSPGYNSDGTVFAGSNDGYIYKMSDPSYYSLSINKDGTGNGTVTASSGTITWNGSSGKASYMVHTTVTLTAIADSGSSFSGWGGACSGMGTCLVTLDNAKNVTATFKLLGVCGNSNASILTAPPASNFCSVGAASAVSGSGPWTWICEGNGIVSVNCIAYKQGMAAITLPRTGQTSCYSTSGSTIPCTGTGQDGELRAGVAWPSPRTPTPQTLVPADSNQTFRDNLTGLTWSRDANPAAIKKLPATGAITGTGNFQDIAINGAGFFQLLLDDGSIGYTRGGHSGSFYTSNGKIVWQGNPLVPEINVPANSSNLSFALNGTVSVYLQGQSTPTAIGAIQLAAFPYPQKLALHKFVSAYVPTAASGVPTIGTPGQGGLGTIVQSAVETAPGAMTWQQGLDFVKLLNNELYLGFNDWRLPNLQELESSFGSRDFLELCNFYPPTSEWDACYYSVANLENKYWSSTSLAGNPANAWVFSKGFEYTFSYSKTDLPFYVWPVRGEPAGAVALPHTGQDNCFDSSGTQVGCSGTGQNGEIRTGMPWPIPRFALNGDQSSYTDNLTGLAWPKDTNVMKTRDPSFDKHVTAGDGYVDWIGALEYVQKLNSENYLGHHDWRLPNRVELESMVNRGVSDGCSWLGTEGFGNCLPGGSYWTSSTDQTPSRAWEITLSSGSINHNDKSGNYSNGFVWPVRGGTINSLTALPGSQQFSDIPVNQSSAQRIVTLVNMGTTPLAVNSIGIVGTDAGQFSVVAGTCPSLTPTLIPEGNCTLIVTFSPISAGSKAAAIAVSSNSSATPTLNIALNGNGIAAWPLTVTMIPGTGSGTVTSIPQGVTPPGISCTSGTCTTYFPANTSVALTATPSIASIFDSWTGDCNGAGNCNLTMNANKSVSATFRAAPKAKVLTREFQTLQAAYDDINTINGSTIKLLEGAHTDTFTAGRGITVTLDGGWNASFNAISSWTAIPGPIIFKAGSVGMNAIVVK